MHGEGQATAFEATVALGRLDGYVLHERVGEGGMGIVHRAVDAHGQVVAVKLLRPHIASDAESRARFAREARVLSRVTGPHVAEVIDADVVSEVPYLVTRFVQGRSLQEVVKENGPLQGGNLADLGGDLADALRSIHAAGIVHRDLKPANVLLESTQTGEVAVLVDFGIAQLADETRMTMTGMVYGTPGFVAPEVLTGGDVTPAADIHAWAGTISFAATGRAPFGSGPLEAVAYRVLQHEPDLTGCPDWLLPVLVRCFAKDPAARPTSEELLRWLETGEAPPARASVTPHTPPTLVFPDEGDLPPARPLGQDFSVRQTTPLESGKPAKKLGIDPDQVLRKLAERGRAVRLTLVASLLAIGALAANVPVIAGVVAVAWLVLARTADRSARFMKSRRTHSGARKTDGVFATIALPWHASRAALMTGMTAPIAAGGAGIVILLGGLVIYAAGVAPRADLLLAAGGMIGALFAWWGFDGDSVRRGTRRILGATLVNRGITAIIVASLVCLTVLFASLAALHQIAWWPLPDLAPNLPAFIREHLPDLVKSYVPDPFKK